MKLDKGQKIQLGGAGIELEAIVLESNSKGFRFIEVATEGRSSLITGFYSFSDKTITLDHEVPVEESIAHFIDDNGKTYISSPEDDLFWSFGGLMLLTVFMPIAIGLALWWSFIA